MNLKASFFNFDFLKENIKKSKGVIFLFIFVIPIFTYLFMLLNNDISMSTIKFLTLSELSIPTIIGLYIAPFVIAASLFSFVFKKDSVDFINALPIKRETIFITNIIGGIIIFFVIFVISTLIMFISSFFFDKLVIPSGMYFHYFITFFITYVFVFIASCLTVSLTGSRIVHVALTLIIVFIPGFINDFYNSRVYSDNYTENYYYATCDKYDESCRAYDIYNDFTIKKSYQTEMGTTLPYKYVSILPQAIFGMSTGMSGYNTELSNVYNLSSIIKMLVLSVVYFIVGLYVYVRRRMEIAEITFKDENAHQIVKCLTLFPLCLGAISLFNETNEIISLWIMLAIIITIYVVYDLITRRNSRNFTKSVIYFLGLVLTSMLIYISIDYIGNRVADEVITKEDVTSIGIAPTIQYGYEQLNKDVSILDYKIKDTKVIDLIFDNVNKQIPSVIDQNKLFAIRLQLKNKHSYYFNMRLTTEAYNQLLDLLDKDSDYVKAFKQLPYDEIYGVKLGQEYLNDEISDKVVSLIKKGYEDKTVRDIANATYFDVYGNVKKYNLTSTLYAYDDGIKTYSVSTMINPDLTNYVMQTSNTKYLNDIKAKNININQLSLSIDFDYNNDPSASYYSQYVYDNQDIIYRYVNDNVKDNLDFSQYTEDEIICVNVYSKFVPNGFYQAFLPADEQYQQILKEALKHKDIKSPGIEID